MPKLLVKRDPAISAALAERQEFTDVRNWRRSRKGNAWRVWEGVTLTVFYREGRYRYSLNDELLPELRFSEGNYDSEEEAVEALADELGVGWV
jgi:hypothetical protein